MDTHTHTHTHIHTHTYIYIYIYICDKSFLLGILICFCRLSDYDRPEYRFVN